MTGMFLDSVLSPLEFGPMCFPIHRMLGLGGGCQTTVRPRSVPQAPGLQFLNLHGLVLQLAPQKRGRKLASNMKQKDMCLFYTK